MNTLVHADVFFFISAVGFIVLAAIAAVLLYYAIVIARDMRSVMRIMREEAEGIKDDIRSVRGFFKREKKKVAALLDSVFFWRESSRRRKKGGAKKE